MARSVRARFADGLRGSLVASALFLQGCPLSDDYYIDEDATGGSWGRGGSGGSFGGSWNSGGTSSGGTSSGGSGGCHEEVRGKATYLFCSTERTYEEAEATCANAGMSLVVINDAPENDWVRTTLDRWYIGLQPFGFIGADDRDTEGQWRLADGKTFWNGGADGAPAGPFYVRWGAGQPNDLSPVTMTQEDCGAVQLGDGMWNDVRCELACPFACESE